MVRSVGPFLNGHPAYTGMTISVDGSPVLILDPGFLVQEQRPESSTATPVIVPDAQRRQPYVLVVDDSLSVRKVAERYLANQSFAVKTAVNGREALDMIRSERPMMVITDLEMPIMDGLSLIRAIRLDDTALPIAVISSRGSDKHQQAAQDVGANAYLVKPFTEEVILKIIAGTHR